MTMNTDVRIKSLFNVILVIENHYERKKKL